MRDLLDLTINAAHAGAEVLAGRTNDMGEISVKSTEVDVVTYAEVAFGGAVAEVILATLPAARFVIEEEEVHDLAGAPRGSLTDEEVWVIDPLDGTS